MLKMEKFSKILPLSFWLLLFFIINFNFCYANELSIINILTADRLNVSEDCKADINLIVSGVMNKEEWALMFLDANGRLPSGILKGNFFNWGHYDECYDLKKTLKNVNKTIYGKYCLGSIVTNNAENISESFRKRNFNFFTKMSAKIGMCVPNTCTTNDVNTLYQPLSFDEKLCFSQTKVLELTTGAIVTLCVLIFILLLAVLSTIYDLYTDYNGIERNSPILLIFSLTSNWKDLIKTSNSSDNVSCLDGIRAISMIWIVLGHTYAFCFLRTPTNLAAFKEFITKARSLYLMTTNLSVDTFFVVSGSLLSYLFLKSKKTGVKFNIFMFYFHRYLRLTPALAVMIFVNKYLIRYFANGPKGVILEEGYQKPCEDWGWLHALLYLPHYYFSEIIEACVAQSWYLNVDFQLYILSPLALIPLYKWRSRTIIALIALFFCGIIVPMIVTWSKNLYCTDAINCITEGFDNNVIEYHVNYYFATYARFSPYIAGLILGYVIYDYQERNYKINMSKITLTAYWIFSVFGLFATMYPQIHVVSTSPLLVKALYLGFQRPIWSCFICLVIYACVTGNGGLINKFLSLPIFQLIRKLSYSIYLVHITVLAWRYSATQISDEVSEYTYSYDFWGTFMVCFFISIVHFLLFESPIVKLEKIIFKRGKKQLPDIQKEHAFSTKL